jgi:hypothetical protein
MYAFFFKLLFNNNFSYKFNAFLTEKNNKLEISKIIQLIKNTPTKR